MALLDIDEENTKQVVTYESSVDGMLKTVEFGVPSRGDNSFQIVSILTDDVRSIRCDFKGSGALEGRLWMENSLKTNGNSMV